MGKDEILTDEEHMKSEMQFEDDQKLMEHYDDPRIELWKIHDKDQCASIAAKIGFSSTARFKESYRRVSKKRCDDLLIEEDKRLPIATELHPIQLKLWKPQAEQLLLSAQKRGVHVPRAEDIVRRYRTEVDA